MSTPSMHVNLIPRKRRAARRVSSCLRSWAVFGVVYLLAVAGACALFITATAPAHDPLERDVSGIAAQITAAKERLAKSRAELTTLTRRLAATQEVQGHPDWSVLLGLIASKRGPGLVLATLELRPIEARSPDGRAGREVPAARPAGYTLRLTGLGKDHAEVAQFALRLEEAALFSQVVLKDTIARPLAARMVVSFGIECTLRDTAGVAGAEK